MYCDLALGFGALLFYPVLLQLGFSNVFAHKVITSIDFKDVIASQLGLAVFWYFGALILCHLVVILAIWWISCAVLDRFRIERNGLAVGLGIMCFFMMWFYAANAYFFPNSNSAVVAASLFNWKHGLGLFLASAVLIWIVTLLASWLTISKLFLSHWQLWLKLSRVQISVLALGGVLLCSVLIIPVRSLFADFISRSNRSDISSEYSKKPDVILLGIDSLRPDLLDSDNELVDIPNIKEFVNRSIRFEKAYTPLARTYASWNSILTGTYPVKHGAIFNLIDERHRNQSLVTIADRLKAEGYKTVYATDEKRFSNIDEKFGFDQIIGPPMGAADFLLGTLNDFPLSNLLANTPLGKVLFPYSHANRAASVTYEPKTFVSMVEQELSNKGTHPAFLSIHLCLAHWPYKWRTSAVEDYGSMESDEVRYVQALNTVDKQFGQLLSVLRNKGYLDEAITVLLSDHGEGLSTDRYSLKPLNGETGLLFGETYGHGTDVLNPKQYEVVLAFRGFGTHTMKAGIARQSTGLIDIAPTIADLIDLSTARSGQYDGISLRPWLDDIHSASFPRYFFIETGFSIPAIILKNPKMADVFAQGHAHYSVLPDGRVVIKDSSMPLLISKKQYAVYRGDMSFVRFPKKNRDGLREVIIDHQKKVYFDPNQVVSEDIQHLRTALYEHFGTLVN